MTDAEGTVVNRYAYDAFGQVATNAVETIPNPFKYIGRYGVMTDAPDLVSMRARYYLPSLGRFTSQDPLGFLGGDLNLYAYVGNNPVNLIDPLGLLEYPQDEIEEDWVSTALIGVGAFCALQAGGGTALTTGVRTVATSAFRPGGWLNRGPWLRVGFGQHQGRRVFRSAGRVIDWLLGKPGAKIDFWKGGPL